MYLTRSWPVFHLWKKALSAATLEEAESHNFMKVMDGIKQPLHINFIINFDD